MIKTVIVKCACTNYWAFLHSIFKYRIPIKKNSRSKFILFWILVYPSIISLFKHLGTYFCIKQYYCAFLRSQCRCFCAELQAVVVFETLLMKFLWLWPHRCYLCVFEFLDVRCRTWSPLLDSLLPAPRSSEKRSACPNLLFNLFLSTVGILRALKVNKTRDWGK